MNPAKNDAPRVNSRDKTKFLGGAKSAKAPLSGASVDNYRSFRLYRPAKINFLAVDTKTRLKADKIVAVAILALLFSTFCFMAIFIYQLF
ncbi:MAG: hypothetical protein ACD_68C00026G0002 [uncultured bacterium]|nr:MAG: hypothetical protein ACD_68C00026G0002 [uncultured bacterium]